ncbi:NADP-dependent oxidoreductase [Marinobacter sp. ELB17]|uniref:NADP-dependent oxidoreductase n=1 Tax=Marinobacter sp. ELB17 TaxID=270374 RepID=UPI0000F3B01B|nr:NADP-dependent oxidoreductase [Marinobacter sp. ELB17]EAZ99136.1 Predicted NADP-dependent oxidoreductase [Marinobacter sp. ELB17]
MSTYKAINLVKRNEGHIGPELFEMVEKTAPQPADGEFVVKQAYMSLDPAMMGWMTADTDSYIPRVELGTVMRSSGIGEVVASNHADFAVGDQVMGMFGWQEMALTDGTGVNKVDKKIPPEMALSVFALPGLTATQGLFGCGHPKAGETLVVSGAAGSVGSIVGQLAKAEGLRVIGVVGSDEKAGWIINELGFDGAVNYKIDDLGAKLDELAPEGVDVYFENTGGPIQDAVFERMNAHGRIVVCGMIADYTSANPSPGPNWMRIIKKRLKIQGFTMPDHMHKAGELQAKLAPYVQSGQVKYRAHVLEGLESAMGGLSLFLTGDNKGKLMVRL